MISILHVWNFYLWIFLGSVFVVEPVNGMAESFQFRQTFGWSPSQGASDHLWWIYPAIPIWVSYNVSHPYVIPEVERLEPDFILFPRRRNTTHPCFSQLIPIQYRYHPICLSARVVTLSERRTEIHGRGEDHQDLDHSPWFEFWIWIQRDLSNRKSGVVQCFKSDQ